MELRPSTQRIRVFSAMRRTTMLRVDADECEECGSLYPAEGAVETQLAAGAGSSVAPPAP